jgi:hypothetical protein
VGSQTDLDIEVAAVLEVVAQIARASDQEILIDGALVEYRDVSLQVPLETLAPSASILTLGPPVGVNRGADAVRVGKVIRMIQRDRGGEAILLFVSVRMFSRPDFGHSPCVAGFHGKEENLLVFCGMRELSQRGSWCRR